MKATVVILVRTPDVKLPAGQPLAIPISASLQDVAVLGADKTNRADKSTIHHESVPPFWTWFIENPRPTLPIYSFTLEAALSLRSQQSAETYRAA
jgi:hypothetical protein